MPSKYKLTPNISPQNSAEKPRLEYGSDSILIILLNSQKIFDFEKYHSYMHAFFYYYQWYASNHLHLLGSSGFFFQKLSGSLAANMMSDRNHEYSQFFLCTKSSQTVTTSLFSYCTPTAFKNNIFLSWLVWILYTVKHNKYKLETRFFNIYNLEPRWVQEFYM